ncbi:NAD(P)/FAD-dependent oxidoreductase [Microbacterium sp.]|uniref:NAD(P)/FAD-dependent oxidoreductase n=1 Tax=Microbacterium sp. TaxID=51671 RepID=UPI0028118EBB|nr:NAD(P)/FAD-dependent oxidoreductase [Microbacterium sp.]
MPQPRSDAPANTYDVAVVGGGPAGLSAALSLARARRRVIVLDAGEPRNAVAAHMHGVLGHDGIPPELLRQRGREEVTRFGGVFVDEQVAALALVDDGRGVHVRGSAVAVTARRVVIATGLRDGLPEIDGIREQWGRGVLVCPHCDGWEHRDDIIGVVATGPGGIDQAHQVRQWSERVVYFPNDVGEPSSRMRRSLEVRGIRIDPGRVARVVSRNGRLAGVDVAGRRVAVDCVFTSTRLRPRDGLLRGLGARVSQPDGEWTVVDEQGRTSIAHVWAVGNVVDPRSNVSVSLGAGSLLAGAVNADLTAEDIDLALVTAPVVSTTP